MPLLQSVQTLVRKKTLTYTKYGNGWVLAARWPGRERRRHFRASSCARGR